MTIVCSDAPDTMYPNGDVTYDEWLVPLHEVGHSVEHTLAFEEESDQFFKHKPGYDKRWAREWIAWKTIEWFESRERMGVEDKEFMLRWFENSKTLDLGCPCKTLRVKANQSVLTPTSFNEHCISPCEKEGESTGKNKVYSCSTKRGWGHCNLNNCSANHHKLKQQSPGFMFM